MVAYQKDECGVWTHNHLDDKGMPYSQPKEYRIYRYTYLSFFPVEPGAQQLMFFWFLKGTTPSYYASSTNYMEW